MPGSGDEALGYARPARLERGAAMAKDTRNHRNPSVVNRLPRGRDEASLWRVLRPARVEEASACGLCRGHEAAVRTQGAFQPWYAEAEHLMSPAQWCPVFEAAFGRATLDPPATSRIGQRLSLLGCHRESNARSVRSCQGRDGTLQRSLVWEALGSRTTLSVLLPPSAAGNGFPPPTPGSLTQMEQERRPVSGSPSAPCPPEPRPPLGTLTRGGGESAGRSPAWYKTLATHTAIRTL